jgi:hypothetical protein
MSDFDAHLENLRESHRETSAVLRVLFPRREDTDEVFRSSWEILYDQLCEKSRTASLDDLNTASAVIYKLSQSTHQLATLEQKTLEFAENRARLRAAAQTAAAALREHPGLPPAVRAEIEHDLNLLA